MANNNDKKQLEKERKSAENYYQLHSQAVKDLVTANEENSPVVSEAELRKYRSGSKLKISETLKALLIKFWFNGSVCFFFFWGLGSYLRDLLDQLVVLGLALGIITDILVNNVLRYIEKTPGANDRWMMVPKKQLSNLFLNIVYAYVVLSFVYMFYNLINSLLSADGHELLGVGPLLFGLFYLGFDLAFIGLKHLFLRIIDDAKKKVQSD